MFTKTIPQCNNTKSLTCQQDNCSFNNSVKNLIYLNINFSKNQPLTIVQELLELQKLASAHWWRFFLLGYRIYRIF